MNNSLNTNNSIEDEFNFVTLIQSFSTLFFSFSISFYIIAIFYKSNNQSEICKIKSETKLRKKYFYKYKELFDLTLPVPNPNKLNFKNKFIKDETSRKDTIILGYNKENENLPSV